MRQGLVRKVSDQEKISKIIASDKIQEKGGIVMLSSTSGIYKAEEFTKYLSDIAGAIEKSNPSSNDEVGVMIHTPDHAMALVYERVMTRNGIVSCWRFMDINNTGSVLRSVDDVEDFVGHIRANYHDSKEYFILSTSVITTEKNPNKKQLIDDINSIKVSSSVTPEKLDAGTHGSLSNKFVLATAALVEGNIDALKQLEPKVVDERLDIDYIHPRSLIYLIEQAQNPNILEKVLIKAAKLDFPSVIDACAKKIDIKSYVQANEGPFRQSPMLIAAHEGNLKAIIALHKHGVEYGSMDGVNIAHIAASEGHNNIIAWLVTHEPQLLMEKNPRGETPAEIAVEHGHDLILHEILKSTVLSIDDWNNLLFRAAEEGRSHLISLFVTHGVDLGQKNSVKHSAAHIAAYYRQAAFLSELGGHGVDLCAKDVNGETPLSLGKMGSILSRRDSKEIENVIKIYQSQKQSNNVFDEMGGAPGLSKLIDGAGGFMFIMEYLNPEQRISVFNEMGGASALAKFIHNDTQYDKIMMHLNEGCQIEVTKILIEQHQLPIDKMLSVAEKQSNADLIGLLSTTLQPNPKLTAEKQIGLTPENFAGYKKTIEGLKKDQHSDTIHDEKTPKGPGNT